MYHRCVRQFIYSHSTPMYDCLLLLMMTVATIAPFAGYGGSGDVSAAGLVDVDRAYKCWLNGGISIIM